MKKYLLTSAMLSGFTHCELDSRALGRALGRALLSMSRSFTGRTRLMGSCTLSRHFFEVWFNT